MPSFSQFLLLELKRLFRTRNTIILFLFFCICLGFVQYGINEYKDILRRKGLFQEIEKNKVSQYVTYTQYGVYGFRIFFAYHPLSIFFINSGGYSEVESFVDCGERLKIYSSLQGQNLFKIKIKKSGLTDFSGILLFLGGLLVFFYGLETLSYHKYLKLLVSLSSAKTIFFSQVFSRAAIIFLILLILLGSVLLQARISGITLSFDITIFYYFITTLLVLLFFFAIGVVLSTIKSRITGISIGMALWLLFLFFIPAAIYFYSANQSKSITQLYKLENDKLKIVMSFEKRAIEKSITYKYGEKLKNEVKDIALSFYNNEFRKIHGLEEAMRKQMDNTIKKYHRISLLFPSSFYLAFSEEISSRGLMNLMDFYSHTQNQKKEFFKFYMNKLYFSSNFSKIENFVKGDENTFNAPTRIPHYFGWGILLTLLYSGGLFYYSYRRFEKMLYLPPEKQSHQINPDELSFRKGHFEVYYSYSHVMPDYLYSNFSGRSNYLTSKGFPGKITIDGQNFHETPFTSGHQFVYLCSPDKIPEDITAIDFLDVISSLLELTPEEKEALVFNFISPLQFKLKMSQLEDYQQGELLLAALQHKKREIYLIEDTAKGMPIEFNTRFLGAAEKLAQEGGMVLYLTTDDNLPTPRRSIHNPVLLIKSEFWAKNVELSNEMITRINTGNNNPS